MIEPNWNLINIVVMLIGLGIIYGTMKTILNHHTTKLCDMKESLDKGKDNFEKVWHKI